MPPARRSKRHQELAVRLALAGACSTLSLSQFPSPLSHIFIAAANYALLMIGQEDALDIHRLNFNWLYSKSASLQRRSQENALLTGLVTGGVSVLPYGWAWSTLLSGVVGYCTSEVLQWGC